MSRLAAAPLAFAAALTLIAGCSGGRRVDPLAGIQVSRGPSTAGLTLAVVRTENTVNSMKYLKTAAHLSLSGAKDADAVITKDAPAMLGRHFKSVPAAESFEAAQALHPDLICLLDAYAHHQGYGIGRFAMDMKLVLLTPERVEVDTIIAQRSKVIGLSGATPVGWWVWASAQKEVKRKVVEDLDAGLTGSLKLAAWVASRGGQQAAPAKVWASDVDRPGYAKAENPESAALIVGIEKYSSMPDAQFAERDAAAVREHLAALGVPARNIRLLSGSQATRASLTKELESWLPQVAGEGSTVFFYYSGHGAPDLKTGQAYLVPWDGDAAYLKDTALPIAEVYKDLNALKAKNIVVALDSCFSGRGARSLLPRGARPLVTKLDTAAGAVGKLLVLTASADDQIAGGDQAQGHGIFTYYLLKGLSDGAAGPDGAVTLKSIYDYLVPKVRDAAGRENRDQVPQLLKTAASPPAELRLR
ncbi:MAG: caspase family protein [Elusimicrobia bacterium]|nr:caspase family protein [Elusimicrobiota bacterium]